MRLGGPLFTKFDGPAGWIAALRAAGYTAAYCPVGADAGDDTIAAYAQAARDADIVIAEVGAWSNPISDDAETRRAAHDLCCRQLALADRIGARCCVNIAGSRGDRWDGPDPRNLSEETFDRIVASVRAILDAVRPARTFYTLETMPWIFPDSPESYLRLIRAIDRPAFAVHLDPTNLVCSPQRYFATGTLLRDCFEALGPQIRSCHAKDIAMDARFIVHLDEVRPGTGALDYAVFLHELSRLDPDTPLMLEHLATEEEYRLAAEHVRAVARREGIALA